MTNKSEASRNLFKSGANCAQAVLGAYAEECGLTHEQAMKMASSFGAGMGRLREVCGAVSGMFMVIGLLQGYSDIKSKSDKDRHYALIQKLAAEFKSKTGSIICRELLGLSKGTDSPVSEERTAEYYKKRPCVDCVILSTFIIDAYLVSLNADGRADIAAIHQSGRNAVCPASSRLKRTTTNSL